MEKNMPHATARLQSAGWVDTTLLAGDDHDVCLWLGGSVDRRELREHVAAEQRKLQAAGLAAGGTVSLRLPPSLGYVACLLAAWRVGAQVSLLDHRLTQYEVDRALDRLRPQVLVQAEDTVAPGRPASTAMRGFAEIVTAAAPRSDGASAATEHALVQLSSGSTGPSKVIARTADDLIAELGRYAKLDGYPRSGDRIVCLASIVHVLGLVGGLLHALHAGVQLVFAERLTPDGILAAVAAGERPTMILGVPFHAELLTSVADPPPLPQLARMVVAGELVRPHVPGAFTAHFGVPLGTMYGMTELGVIATDLHGHTRPAVAPAPGMGLRTENGELLVRMAASPYIGLVDPTRWSDGWLRTRDAAVLDPATGLVTILGRLDSQVSVGGLKVDLTEVEQTIAALPGVAEVVVLFDDAITAYLALNQGVGLAEIEQALTRQLASFKRPRRIHVVPGLPRTATGKIVRDRAALRRLIDREPVTQ
jgi:3-hydroxy-4-methylanthranilate adenylyltransferase